MLLTKIAVRLLFTGAVALASAVVPVATAHASDPAAISALFERNSSNSVYRQAGTPNTTVNVAAGTSTLGDVTVPILHFTSQVGSDSSTLVAVSISAGLTPGTYATSRLPGHAAALLDPGSILACGGEEPGTLTITDATYDVNGLPIVLSGSFYVAPCDEQPAVHGELRWNSTSPLGLAQAPDVTSISGAVVVNSTADLVVTFTAQGNGPMTAGAATLSQTPPSDGSNYWTIQSDACIGQILNPGDTCAVTVRFAPLRPNGVPLGTIYAAVSVPDGQSNPARAVISAKVAPLPGQAVGLQVEGAFRHLVLRWGAPQAYPNGWSRTATTYYEIYRDGPGGTRDLITTQAGQTFYVVPDLPDLYTATYEVTATQNSTGPPSVPATGSTSSRELLFINLDAGVENQQLAPAAEPARTGFVGSSLFGSAESGFGDLAVSRNQSTMAWTTTNFPGSANQYAIVSTTRVDGSGGSNFASDTSGNPIWDTEPSVSPDGKRVVYTHAAAQGATTQLRIAATTNGSTSSAVSGSTGLSQAAFTADGASVVAVQVAGASTRLVRLALATGVITVIPGTNGLSDPDVAADGRIVAVDANSPDQPLASGLVIVNANGSELNSPANAQTGQNLAPEFSTDGTEVYFTHRDDYADTDFGVASKLNLASGAVTALADGTDNQTPYVLQGAIPGTFQPLAPTRLLDTRLSLGGVKPGAGGHVTLSFTGHGGVPQTGVAAVVLNVTVTAPTTGGYLSAYPDGTTRPTASNVNYAAAQTIAGLVVVPLGSNGKVDLYTSANTQVIADVEGYYLAGTPSVTGAFASLAPTRLLDTRLSLGGVKPGAGGHVTLSITGHGGVPQTGVAAVVLNVTVTAPTTGGYLSAYPDGTTRPTASNVNYAAAQTIAGLVVVPLGSNGKVDLYTSANTQVIADVEGYYLAGTPSVTGAFASLAPTRLLDTRLSLGGVKPGAGGHVTLSITGHGGVPQTGVAAVVLNVTVTAPTTGGYLSAYPDGTTRPTASNVNYAAAQTIAGLVVVPLGSNGKVDLYTSANTQVIADVEGYYLG